MRLSIFLALAAILALAAPSLADETPQDRSLTRVIVELNVAMPSGQALSNPETLRRTLEIVDQAQDALIRELAGTGTKVHRRYRVMPALALEGGSEMLVRLMRSHLVDTVRPDLDRTLPDGGTMMKLMDEPGK